MRDRRLPLANLITMGPATIGLRKIDNRWTVTHEDHSFADTTDTPDHSAAQIRAVHEHWFDRTAAKDLEGP